MWEWLLDFDLQDLLTASVSAGTVILAVVAYLQKIDKIKAAGQLLLVKRAFDAVTAGVKAGIDNYNQTAAAEFTKQIALTMEQDTPGVAGEVKALLIENGNHVDLSASRSKQGNGARVD